MDKPMVTRADERNPADLGASALYLGRRAVRYWKAALVVSAVGLVGTAALVKTTPQIYRSETVLLYSPIGRQNFGDVETSRRMGARLEDMLRKRERLETIRKEFNLNPEVGPKDRAVEEMRKQVGFRIREGSTFVISFDGHTPALVQAATRRLAETLIEENRRMRADDAAATSKLLDDELVRLRAEVAKREEKLLDFTRQHPELAPPEPTAALGGIGEGMQIFEMEKQLAQLRTQLASPGEDRSPVATGPTPDMLQAVQRAELEYEQAQKDLAAKREHFTEAHPDMITAVSRVKLAEKAYKRAQAAVAQAQTAALVPGGKGKPDDKAVMAAISELEARINRARRTQSSGLVPHASSRQAKIMPLEVQRQSLQRDLDQARDQLSDLERNYLQASVAAKFESSGDAGILRVLDPAYLPSVPLTNVKKKMALLGLAGTFFLMLIVAVLRALTDDRIFERGDIPQMTSRPVLVVVPRARGLRRARV